MTDYNPNDEINNEDAHTDLPYSVVGKTALFEFDSLSEYIESAQNARRAHNAEDSSMKGARPGFTTFDSTAEAFAAAQTGWPKGRKAMVSGLDVPTPPSTASVAPARQRRIVGGAVDVPAYLSGAPDCMVGRGEVMTGGAPIVDIYVDGSAHSGIKIQWLTRRGVAIASAIEALESAGYRISVTSRIHTSFVGRGVEIPVTTGSKQTASVEHMDLRVKFKASERHMNLDVLAFVLACPDWLRRVFFRFLECTHPALWAGGAFWGYGRPDNNVSDSCPLASGAFYLPGDLGHRAYKSDQSDANAHVLEVMRKGIEARGAEAA